MLKICSPNEVFPCPTGRSDSGVGLSARRMRGRGGGDEAGWRLVVSGRTLRDHPGATAVSVACRGPRRRRHRHARPIAAPSPGGRPVLSEVAQRRVACPAPADHGHSAELRGGSQRSDAVSHAPHGAIREQSNGGVSPADPLARTPDAKVHVPRARATGPVGARRRVESVPCRPPRAALRPPLPGTHPSRRVWREVTCA